MLKLFFDAGYVCYHCKWKSGPDRPDDFAYARLVEHLLVHRDEVPNKHGQYRPRIQLNNEMWRYWPSNRWR